MSGQTRTAESAAADLQALYAGQQYQSVVDRFEALRSSSDIAEPTSATALQIAAQAYGRIGDFAQSAATFLHAAVMYAETKSAATSVCMRNAFGALQRSEHHDAAEWVALRSLSLPRECGCDPALLRHSVAFALRRHVPTDATAMLAMASRFSSTRSVALEMLLDMALQPTKYGSFDAPYDVLTAHVGSNEPKLSIIVCSRDDTRYARFELECDRALHSTHVEIIRIKDARSMCEGYNRGTEAATGELLLYCHDDIEFITDGVHRALLDALGASTVLDVAVCVGSSRIDGPTWMCVDATLSQGWMAAQVEHGNYAVGLMGVPDLGTPLVSGDGCFIACRRGVADALRWDETTFDAFHMYDIDFCLRATLGGYRVGVARGLLINHHSPGSFDLQWRNHGARFASKHGLSTEVPSQAQWISARTGSRQNTERVGCNLVAMFAADFCLRLRQLDADAVHRASQQWPSVVNVRRRFDAIVA